MSGLAVSYFYKNTLKVDPAMLTTVSSLTSLPWTCKPLYGFMSDAFPIFGYRRKPYIFLAGLAGCLSWVLMWCAVDGIWGGFACMMIGSTAIAVANVISEAMVVERSKGESQEFASHLQSVVWGACSVGSLIASFLGGWLLKFMSDRQVLPIPPPPRARSCARAHFAIPPPPRAIEPPARIVGPRDRRRVTAKRTIEPNRHRGGRSSPRR
jgi:MFS family permease